MTKRATLVLAVVVLALFAYILKFERESLTSGELAQRKGKVLTAFVRDKVDRLEIQRKGRRVILERKPNAEGGFDSWRMLEPFQSEADESQVEHLLGDLEWLSARRTLHEISASDRAQFGLDKPRYRVLFGAGGRVQRLSLGQNDVHGEGVYAAVDDEPDAFVIPKTLLEALDHEPGQFRSKAFLGEMVTAWGRKLSIVGDDRRIEIAKKDGRWRVMGENETYADSKGVGKVLRALDELRATRFLEGAEAHAARKALSKPPRTVELRIVPDEGREDKQPMLIELSIGPSCAGHANESYAAAGAAGAPVCVKDEDLKVFAPGPHALAQTQVFSADPSEVESFELSAGTTKLSLKRDGEAWKADGAQEVDREAVEHWLEALTTERGLSFQKLSPLQEVARLTVQLADDTRQTLVIGGISPDGSVLARRDQEPVLVGYRSNLLDLLTPSPRRFASLQLWSHQPSEVQSLDARSRVLTRKLLRVDGAWRPDAKSVQAVDSTRVRELLRELVRLRAFSFVADRARPEHGLKAPLGSLSLSLAPKGDAAPVTLKLELGAVTPRGVYAAIGAGSVYELPREVANLVDELAGGARPVTGPADADDGDEEFEGHGDGHDHDHESP